MKPVESLEDGLLRPPLPGEVWDMTSDEAHCFDAEIRRLQVHVDVEAPSVSHWIALIGEAFKSGRGKITSNAELFAYVQGAYPPALVHPLALRPESADIWQRVVSDPFLQVEMEVTEEEAEARLADAEADVFRLPLCDHLAMEHAGLIDGWYERNVEDTKSRRATLYRVWRLPPEDVLYGKQFIARHDMDREIQEQVDARNRGAEEHMDPETRDSFVLDCEMTPDEADAVLAGMRETRTRDTRKQLVERYEQRYRILK